MRILSRSVKNTLDLGSKIAKNLKKGDIICLFGNLGSGKTVLTKGIARGLGIPKDKIISPTFVLLRQYLNARLPLYHFDLYRLGNTPDILGLGCEEYFYDEGVTIIEWADKLNYLLPKEYLEVKLTTKGRLNRLLQFKAIGKRYQGLLKKI